MTRHFLAILMLASAAPVVAQDTGAYEQAVAARLAGDPERAIGLLEPVLAANPGNSDARLQLGLALLALDRLDEAEQAFLAVLDTAPDYADARIGLARIAQRRGDREAALAELDHIVPGNAEAGALRGQLAQPRWRVDLDGSYAALEGPASDWHGAAVQLRHQATPATAITGRAERAHRFGRTDLFGEVRLDQQLSPGVYGYIALGVTPDADFLPEWQLSAGGAARVRDGGNATVLTLDLRLAQYLAGDVEIISPGIEQYFADGRLWVTGRWINVFDEADTHRSGYLLRLDGLATDKVRLFAGYSNAPDTAEGVVIDTEAFFGGASVEIGERTTLRASVARENRETGTDRTEFGLGLGVRF